MDEAVNGAAPAAPEGNAAPAVSTPSSIEDTMSAVFDRMTPPRSDGGQFATKVSPDSEAQAAPADEAKETNQEPAAPTVEPAKPAIDPPLSWTAEMKAKWASLPPDTQEYIAKRDGEAHKRITELGETAKSVELIRAVIDKYRTTFDGVPVQEGLERLLAANQYLERSPVEAIQWLAKAYNVDLSAFGVQQQDGQHPEASQFAALNAEIANLKRQLHDTSTRVQTREQREADERTNALNRLVNDFAKEKPYWGEIESDVLEQIHAVRMSDPNLSPDKVLEKAHERALKLNDSVAAKLNEAKRKDAEAKEAADKKRKADEAKRLSSMNVKTSQGTSPRSTSSMEETMREVANRLMG